MAIMIGQRGSWVRASDAMPVSSFTGTLTVVEKTITPNYTMLKFSRADMFKIIPWCEETGCGKVVNRTSIAFKTAAEITMFTLKWSPRNV
jgi:hypothetical protein